MQGGPTTAREDQLRQNEHNALVFGRKEIVVRLPARNFPFCISLVVQEGMNNPAKGWHSVNAKQAFHVDYTMKTEVMASTPFGFT
jgi:hypothetical protein